MIHTLLYEVPVLPQPATRLPSCVIRQVSCKELYSDDKFNELIKEYEVECLVDGFPAADLQLNMYRMMELGGNFHLIAAYINDELVGFVTMIVNVLPHSGKLFGSVESYFVGQNHRKHGPGLDLLHAVEWLAKQCGAVGLLVTAPKGGKLARVMPRAKYKQTHEVFFKGFA